MTTPKTTSKPNRFQFFSKQTFILSLFIGGGAYYFFVFRSWNAKRKRLAREAEAIEFWKLHNKEIAEKQAEAKQSQ